MKTKQALAPFTHLTTRNEIDCMPCGKSTKTRKLPQRSWMYIFQPSAESYAVWVVNDGIAIATKHT
jgi:hypothetical protein